MISEAANSNVNGKMCDVILENKKLHFFSSVEVG